MQFKSLQYALFSTSFVEVLGGVFFLLTSAYILRDKAKVEAAVAGKSIHFQTAIDVLTSHEIGQQKQKLKLLRKVSGRPRRKRILTRTSNSLVCDRKRFDLKQYVANYFCLKKLFFSKRLVPLSAILFFSLSCVVIQLHFLSSTGFWKGKIINFFCILFRLVQNYLFCCMKRL